MADLYLANSVQVTSASLLTLALNFSPRAETTFKIVSKLGSAAAKPWQEC
jgi:hypothetical protein